MSLLPKPIHISWKNPKLRYLAVGIWNTLFGYISFAILYLTLHEQINYMTIATLSHFIAVTQSFVAHKKLVFFSRGSWVKEYFRFNLTHLAFLVYGLFFLRLMVETAEVKPLLAQAIVTVSVVVGSYFAHRRFTFRKNNQN